jgi:beta-exotoxin I transport system permease protein
MTGAAIALEIRRSRTLVFWLGIVTALYAGFISLFYANVADNAEQWKKLLEVYPKELMLAFGIEGNFADPGVFLGAYVYSFLWPFIGSIAAIALATRVAADVDRGFADVVLATPLDRRRQLLASIVVQVAAIAFLAVVMVAFILLADLVIEPNFPADRVALSAVHATAFGVAIAGVTTLLAVLLLDRGRAAAIAAGALVVMYLLNVVAAIAPEYRELGVVSAFRYLDLKGLVSTGAYPVENSLLFLAVGIGGWVLALLAFRSRDLAA